VEHVTGPNSLDVRLEIGFRVTIVRKLLLEAIDGVSLSAEMRKRASHCLVVIAGGKDIIGLVDDTGMDGHIRARLYLPVTPAATHPGAATPAWSALPLTDVGECLRWASQHDFDAAAVRTLMKDLG
jgi:hypothetical protein